MQSSTRGEQDDSLPDRLVLSSGKVEPHMLTLLYDQRLVFSRGISVLL